ncbi:MAG: 4Fe-4S dicluster domain-containing protein [Asgard group archaeon]|nr:4Fe-4S dicluster domain-containing protein [Asgard group archaeon]
MDSKIIINRDLCTGCEICLEICPRDCFKIDDEEKSVFDSARCHDCGHCISVCPDRAISHRDLPLDDYLLINDYFDPSFKNGNQMYYFLKSIRSTRKFLNKPIEKEVLSKLIDITRYSPTGHNTQNVEVTVINDQEVIQNLKNESAKTIISILKKIDNPIFVFLAKLIGKGNLIRKAKGTKPRLIRMLKGFQEGRDYLFHGAPTVVVFHSNKKSYVPEDNCTLSACYMSILANSFGLGICFIGYLTYYAKYNSKILDILEIPKENKIYQVVIVGYPKFKFQTFVSRKTSKASWK